jgi:PAS domain S-box-containing protein
MESNGQKIVIVEDEGLIAADLQDRLERAGYSVPGSAATGSEALRVIRETSPDLVLMDIRIKGTQDGIQVAEQVRDQFGIPVIYLTAYEDRETLERASRTNAFGYIKKPIASASLRGSIEMALAKHKSERHLREQRDWFSANFAAVPDAVLVTDGFGRVSYINAAAEELTGCKVDNALNRPSNELLRLTYQDGRPMEDLVPLAMLQGTPVPLPQDVQLAGPGEQRFDIEGTVAPKFHEGRVEGAVVTFKDVTLRRFEEEQSRQDDKHEALSRFADGIAGLVDLELNAIDGEIPHLIESLPRGSTIVPIAANIGSALMDTLAVTKRLKAFGQPPEMEPRMLRLVELLARLETIEGLKLRLEPDPRPVYADPWQLSKVLEIILAHAADSMDEGAGISLDTSRAEFKGMREWVRIRIAYISTREAADDLGRAFDPSWDGDLEGVPFAYGLVRRMGGLLTARLQGNTISFEIYLPSVQAAAAGASPESAVRPSVLLIEPNSRVRRMLREHFEQHGYNLLEVADCEEALRLAELYERRIHLAIANPGKDDAGRAKLAEALEALKPGVRVRLLEGYSDESNEAAHLTRWDLLKWANDTVGSLGLAIPASVGE